METKTRSKRTPTGEKLNQYKLWLYPSDCRALRALAAREAMTTLAGPAWAVDAVRGRSGRWRPAKR